MVELDIYLARLALGYMNVNTSSRRIYSASITAKNTSTKVETYFIEMAKLVFPMIVYG